jgi:hypothetical protein
VSDFLCRVGTPDGRVLEEVFSGRDEGSLRGELQRRGLHVFEVKPKGFAVRSLVPSFARARRIKIETFLVFNQELAALLKAGLPLLQALDLMLERMRDLGFREVLTEIRDRVKSARTCRRRSPRMATPSRRSTPRRSAPARSRASSRASSGASSATPACCSTRGAGCSRRWSIRRCWSRCRSP